jgi:ribose transport system ATP-binding protein
VEPAGNSHGGEDAWRDDGVLAKERSNKTLAQMTSNIGGGNNLADQPLLVMDGITKEFPGVRALDDIHFELEKGEVHALVGENGAGKSTLMLILGGVHPDYRGKITLEGEPVRFSSPGEAIAQGIGVIYQELDLALEFSVAENIFLGMELMASTLPGIKRLDRKRMIKKAGELLNDLGFEISPHAKVGSLSIGEQQLVQVAKAIRLSAKVVVMDEPTARLAHHETEALFKNIQSLKQRGVSIIYISHHMEEIMRVADRVTVLRDGKKVGTVTREEASLDDIIHMVVGKELSDFITRPDIEMGEEILRLEGLCCEGQFDDVNFSLRKGEILGIGGLVGSGRTELAQCIFGANKSNCGQIFLEGEPLRLNSPNQAIKKGIVLVPEERKAEGLVLNHSVLANLSIALTQFISKFGVINLQKRNSSAKRMVKDMNIKTPSLLQEVGNLSGGNQQKVVIGKWLDLKNRVFILDQPTRGIDVGAKQEIYHLIAKLAQAGSGVIVISDELPELIGLADRIMIMRRGPPHLNGER